MAKEWENYFVDKELGRGQFGIVWKVKDKRDEKEYALKIIYGQESSGIDKSLEEVKALANLGHQNIVKYHHCWISEPPADLLEDLKSTFGCTLSSTLSSSTSFDSEPKESRTIKHNYQTVSTSTATTTRLTSKDQDHEMPVPLQLHKCLFIKTELCDMNLNEWIETYCFPNKKFQTMKEILFHFFQLVVAVKFIHLKGFIHRDLKPENILVSKYGQNGWLLKIGDFGIVTKTATANLKGKPQANQNVYGTPPFIAPEMENGSCEFDHKVDVYSLGVILLLWLIPMKTIMEKIEVIKQAREGIVINDVVRRFMSSHPIEWKKITEVLTKNPKKRPTSKEFHIWLKKYRKGDYKSCICHKSN